MNQLTALILTASFSVGLLLGQAAKVGEEVRDMTFPEFNQGDGRQKLSEFRGQPVLVVTFADVFGGLSAAMRGIKLAKAHRNDGLVVIMTRVKAGGTFGDGTEGVDLAAWTMKRYPGADVRVCDRVRPAWNWRGLGMFPYYAVIGPDGKLVGVGAMPKTPKGLAQGVATAVAQVRKGWGSKEEAAFRKRLHGKQDLAFALANSTGLLRGEANGIVARRLKAIDWMLDDGQWLRAKKAADKLSKQVAADAEHSKAVDERLARFVTPAGERELGLDKKLQRLLKPFQKRAPGKNADRALRKLAKTATGTTVGARAERMASRVAAAAKIR